MACPLGRQGQPAGAWQINPDGPSKLSTGEIALEKYLEDWIESDPSLLQLGLTIVGRQVQVEGGRIDLLALDTQGRWIVIEIKPGLLCRETIAQALDYASCIARMPGEDLLRLAPGATTSLGARGGI